MLRSSACVLRRESQPCFSTTPAHTEPSRAIRGSGRGRVDFNYIERSPRCNLFTGIAFSAGLRRRSFHAIQGFCQNARRCGFSNSARAGENVRVCYAIILDRVFQRLGYVLLSDKILEPLRAPLARYDLVAHMEVFSFQFSVVESCHASCSDFLVETSPSVPASRRESPGN